MSQLNRLLSSRDSVIRELRASKKLFSQELEIARHDIKVLEDDRVIMKAMCDKAIQEKRPVCATASEVSQMEWKAGTA